MSPAARGLVAPAMATVIVTAILASLGTWQVARLAWKTDLIATMTERTKAAPVAAPGLAAAEASEGQAIDWMPVRLSGRFLAERDVTVHAILGEPRGRHGGSGVWVMTPFARDDGSIVWINRGFVPRQGMTLAAWAPPPSTPLEISGILRRPEPRGTYTPADDPAHRLWFVRDPAVLSAAAAIATAEVAPYTVDLAAAFTPSGGLPQAGETRLSYPNDHLGYAITWYGLALTCAGVFAVFARGRLKRSKV